MLCCLGWSPAAVPAHSSAPVNIPACLRHNDWARTFKGFCFTFFTRKCSLVSRLHMHSTPATVSGSLSSLRALQTVQAFWGLLQAFCCAVPYGSSFCLLGGDWGHCRVCLQDLAVSCHPFLREPRGLVSHFKSWVQIPQYWCQATSIDFECITYTSWYAGFPASLLLWHKLLTWKNPDVVSVFSQAKAAG